VGSQRRSRFHNAGNLDGFFRTATGPGWALVGDAGLHKDPTPGRGISDAFIQAKLLTEVLAAPAASGDRSAIDEALVDYAVSREEWFDELYEATCDMVQYDWAPEKSATASARLNEAVKREWERLTRSRTAGVSDGNKRP